MDRTQLLILLLGQAPMIVTVIIGIRLNNRQFTAIESRVTSMENSLTRIENQFDAHFDQLL
jgi:hypothetical protein